jgi:hypothetical protein
VAENCIYKVKLKNGNEREFSSEEELNSFIRDNKNELVASLLQGQTFFSQEKNLPEQTIDKLKATNKGMHLRKEDHVYYRENANGTKEEGFISTTQWISKKHNLGNPEGSEYMVPEFIEANYFQDLGAELISAGMTQKFVDQRILDLKKSWDNSAVAGTSLHDIAENFALKNYENAQALKNDYSVLTDEQAEMYFTSFDKFFKEVRAEHGEDAIFLPEFIIVDDQKKLTGTIDLLVVDNKGKLHIYDYKTSFKHIADWKQVKKNAVDYQLTTYKQILLRQGFQVGKTKYIPIKIESYDPNKDVVENFNIETIMDSTQSSRGNVVFKINYILPFEFKPSTEHLLGNKAVSEVLLKAFNYEIKNASGNNVTASTAKQELDYLLTNGRRQNDYKGREFIYLPSIGGAKSTAKLYTADLEDTNLQLVNAYLTQVASYNQNLPFKVTDYVKAARKAIKNGDVVDNTVLWNNDDSLTSDYIDNLLGKYINSDAWQAFDSDIMADLGIVAFENQDTNEVDFISLTGKSITQAPALLKGRTTLLGNTLSDRESSDLGFYQEITNGDVELLKVFAFIQNNQATFKDKKIGKIATIQLNSNQSIAGVATQTLSTVNKQWQALVKHGDDFELKGKTWQITSRDNYDSLVAFVKEVFADKNSKIKINDRGGKVIEKLKTLDKLVERNDKLKILSDIQRSLKKDTNNKQGILAATREKQELINLVSTAILQLQNIEFSVENDIKLYGNIVGDNAMVSIPERIRDSIIKHTVNLTTTALNNVRHKFNKDTEGLIDLHSKYYTDANASDFKIKVVGNNYEFFTNLMEKEGDRFTWKFKNPDTDPSLQKHEREYIKGFLKQINGIRRDKLVRLYGEGSNQVEEFDQAPILLEIPLMKASGYTALINKGIKEYAKDYWASLANDTRVLENDSQTNLKLKFQTEMFNQFDTHDTNADARKEYLTTHPDADLENDLEAIVYAYTMANAKQVVFDEALPTLDALKTVAMLSNNFYFKDLENVEGFISNYIGLNIFGKKILAEESAALAKSARILTKVTSTLTLGLSVPTIMTETFNNAFLSISKVFGAQVGKRQFGKDSWMSAEGLVWSDKFTNSQLNVGKMNFTRQLNRMFDIVEGDLHALQHDIQSTSTAVGRNFQSNVMMKLNQIPNYVHRMSFFVAQMIEDGVIKTNGGSFAKDSPMRLVGQTLVYDPKLDGRFALYLNSPNNFPPGKEESWKESRSIYLKIEAELKNEPNGIDPDTGLITRPYENKTRNSLKSTADEVFGAYDPDSKVMFANTAFGQLFNQFKNWMWSKKHRIWSETDVNGRQGKWVYDKDQEDHVWKNDIMEGFGNSMWALFQDVKESRDLMGSWDKLAPERKERILWALSDLVLYALMAGLAGFLIGEFSAEDNPVANSVAKSMRNATSDLAFWSAAGTVITPNNQIPIAGMINRVMQGTAGLITNDHQATQQMMNSLGLYRTLNPVYKQVIGDSEE